VAKLNRIAHFPAVLFISLALVIVSGSVADMVVAARTQDALEAPLDGTRGPQTVVVILAEFPDLRHSTTSGMVRAIVFDQMNAFYRDSSYGLAWIEGKVIDTWYKVQTPVKSLKVQEWGYDYDDMSKFEQEVVNAADNDVDFSDYSYVIIVAAGEVWPHATCDFGIVTNDGVSSLKGFVVNENSEMLTYAHELAHVVPVKLGALRDCGLPDLYSYDAMERDEYASMWVGPWDLMDDGSDFSAWSKIALGWVVPDELPTKPPNILVANLRPLEEDSGSRAVVVELTATISYVVEVRRRIGYDSGLPSEGVLVYHVDTSKDGGHGVVEVVDANPKTPTLDDAVYEKGGLFEDRGNSVYVWVVDTDGVGFTVCISRIKVQSLKDTDSDGLIDSVETQYGTDPSNPDTDGDGLQDGEEITRYQTNPLVADTDGDGLKDGDEALKYETDPLKPDTDGDGVLDGREVQLGTDPLNADSDGDGLSDGDEVNSLGTDPLKSDTDGDGLTDDRELLIRTDPNSKDTDGDLWSDGVDFAPTNSLIPNCLILVVVALVGGLVVAYNRGMIPFRSARQAAPIHPPRGMICIRCGIPNRFNSRFCRRCGTPLRWSASQLCPSCGIANRPTASFCRRCRRRLR